ncbi:cubilin [Caerostris extrusa]|uniref:Cubilin n=1 Tax=Caerostris extrusa TaxID=172846 RepID=A0AAV4Y8U7_CAEEX|nr:cubilin [Caerostris extrusa]
MSLCNLSYLRDLLIKLLKLQTTGLNLKTFFQNLFSYICIPLVTLFILSGFLNIPVCGGVLDVSDYGSFNSPGYPGLYPNDRDCSWLVRVPIGKRIQFHFATLQLEPHDNCSYDYVKVHDGASDTDPAIGMYCTLVTPPPPDHFRSFSSRHLSHGLQRTAHRISYHICIPIQCPRMRRTSNRTFWQDQLSQLS